PSSSSLPTCSSLSRPLPSFPTRRSSDLVDIVVTNHALLAIDAFDNHGIIPEHDVVVFDEAHDLTTRVTSAVTDILTPGMLRGTVDRKSTRLNSSHVSISYAVFCLTKKKE